METKEQLQDLNSHLEAVNMIIYAVNDLAGDPPNTDCGEYTKSMFREICYCLGISMNEIGSIQNKISDLIKTL
jgi:hypothetical protein